MLLKHIKRIVVLAAISGVLLGAASASASTVTVTPGGAVTGTGGWVQLVLNTAGRTIVCTGSGYTATLNTGGSGVTLPYTISTNFQFRFTGCRLNNGLPVTITCSPTASLNVTAATAGSVSQMSITGISCVISASATCTVNLTGRVLADYDNATNRLTIPTTGQSLSLTGSTCASLPNDTSVTLLDSRTGGAATFSQSPAVRIVAS
jgi:hypothetical protein